MKYYALLATILNSTQVDAVLSESRDESVKYRVVVVVAIANSLSLFAVRRGVSGGTHLNHYCRRAGPHLDFLLERSDRTPEILKYYPLHICVSKRSLCMGSFFSI